MTIPNKKYLLLGITGGIASGKSAISAMLVSQGARLIDADVLAREVVQPGQPALQDICDAFGADMLLPDGSLDRAGLGARIFHDPQARERLGAITHPRIHAIAWQRLCHYADEGFDGVVALDAALLIEIGWNNWVDELWVITLPIAARLQRLMARDGIDEATARARIQSQHSDAWRLRYATREISTTGSLEQSMQSTLSALAAAQAAFAGQTTTVSPSGGTLDQRQT